MDLYNSILKNKLTFPEHIEISDQLKDLIRNLIVIDPIGRMSYEKIQGHEWIKDTIDKLDT